MGPLEKSRGAGVTQQATARVTHRVPTSQRRGCGRPHVRHTSRRGRGETDLAGGVAQRRRVRAGQRLSELLVLP